MLLKTNMASLSFRNWELLFIIEKNFRFENSSTGFKSLKKRLFSLTKPFKHLILFALEDTVQYAYYLVIFLLKLGYTVIIYNGLFDKEFVKSLSLRKTKIDVKDALVIVIVQEIKTDTHPGRFKVDEPLQELKENVIEWLFLTLPKNLYGTIYAKLIKYFIKLG